LYNRFKHLVKSWHEAGREGREMGDALLDERMLGLDASGPAGKRYSTT
jgi:hypothetical protein